MQRSHWEALAAGRDLLAIGAALDDVRGPEEVFGAVADPAAARRLYLVLSRAAHPDRNGGSAAAQAVQARIGQLWTAWRIPAGPAATVTTRRGSYPLGDLVASGDLAEIYDAGDDSTGPLVVKLARRPQSNGLLEAEAAALRTLAAAAAQDPRMAPFLPSLVEAFSHADPVTGERRRGTVLRRVDGAVTLADVAVAHPGGLDPRDAAWMWRRLLVALGHAHRAGLVHAAVLPEHVLVLPAEHGLVLVDWCYSVPAGVRARALVPRHAAAYPREVAARQPLGPGTDIAMAAGLLVRLMGDRVPAPMRSFTRGCALPALAARPTDAWGVLAELDDLLDRMWGPRVFRPFAMPA